MVFVPISSMILPASHDVLGVMDVFGIVKLCQRVQKDAKGIETFFPKSGGALLAK